jgi:cellulose synthase/poly-beta-1,6-N-acetylglucosamine synthase-like glycosyltransferase
MLMNVDQPSSRREADISPTVASHDAETSRHDERRQRVTRVIALVASVAGISYLTWRAVFTLNPDALLLSWSLWILEAHAILGLGVFAFSLWHISPSRPPSTELPDGKAAVLIATYNEPPEVLTPVIAGAVALRGAHETWVLDDGNRGEIRELAESLGARYLARPDNTDAKAGNLNHALSVVDADFVGVLDADHVPHRDFLVNTLPYLNDPAIALVQTPQDFYNEDSFEHVDGRRRGRRSGFTEQSLFYRVIQPAKNRWGSAFWCGTGAVLRTAALREVGGVATESLTEDLQTTIRLHRAGWKSRYHDEVLARGLAAPTAEEYQLQRRRWCIGAIQTLRIERPITDRSLTGEQRLSYAATILAWFDSVRVLGLLVLPALVLLTGQAPIAAPLWIFLIVFATTFLLQQWAMVRLGRGQLRPIASTVFDIVRLQATFGALYTALTGREIEFSVTPKGRSSGAVRRIRVPRLLIALAALYLVAFCFYVATIAGFTGVEYGTPGVAHGAAFWLVFGGVILWMSIRRIHALDFAPERRGSHRHGVHARAQLDGQEAVVTDLSLTGARIALVGDAPEPRSGTSIHLLIDVGHTEADLTADVVAIDRHGDGRATVRATFHDGQWEQLARLTEGLFHPASPTPIQREPGSRHLRVA